MPWWGWAASAWAALAMPLGIGIGKLIKRADRKDRASRPKGIFDDIEQWEREWF